MPVHRGIRSAAPERSGQIERRGRRHHADKGEHQVQAGTGTGKSLAYSVPSIVHAIASNQPVVVSTATIALQRQLVDRDLPRLADALAPHLPRRPEFALLKGRGNYLCLNKVHSGASVEEDLPQEELFNPVAASALGRDVKRLIEWSSDTESGDRDEVVPGVLDRAWSQVSVGAGECIGATQAPYGTDCFAEGARAKAGAVDVIVTNHALLAIDAISEVNVPPEHQLLVVDEAHELVDRVTSVATGELSATSWRWRSAGLPGWWNLNWQNASRPPSPRFKPPSTIWNRAASTRARRRTAARRGGS